MAFRKVQLLVTGRVNFDMSEMMAPYVISLKLSSVWILKGARQLKFSSVLLCFWMFLVKHHLPFYTWYSPVCFLDKRAWSSCSFLTKEGRFGPTVLPDSQEPHPCTLDCGNTACARAVVPEYKFLEFHRISVNLMHQGLQHTNWTSFHPDSSFLWDQARC